MVAIKCRNYDPYQFCENWHIINMWKMTYDGLVHATRDTQQWKASNALWVLPPHSKRQSGRPKKNRIPTDNP